MSDTQPTLPDMDLTNDEARELAQAILKNASRHALPWLEALRAADDVFLTLPRWVQLEEVAILIKGNSAPRALHFLSLMIVDEVRAAFQRGELQIVEEDEADDVTP